MIINIYLYIFRKHLRKNFREKIFLPCYAHQLNLCVGDLFKESSNLSRVSGLAIDVISTFRKSTYFMGQLHTEQESIYRGKYVHYHCLATQDGTLFFIVTLIY